MRFHCGISFSWRTIKKFLIPFILGILAILGFSAINDGNVPLGFIQVNALENYDTRYDIDYSNVSNYVNLDIDTEHHKLIDLVNTINSNNNVIYEYAILVNINASNVYNNILLLIFDSSSNYSFNIYGSSSSIYSSFTSSNNYWAYRFSISTLPNDIFTTSNYNSALTCLTGGSCSSHNNFTNAHSMFLSSSSISNTSNNTCTYPISQSYYFFFYSNRDLTINNTYDTNSDTKFYKTIYVNNSLIDVGDSFPTYYDLYLSPEPDPEPEPEPEPVVPDEDTTEHKALFDKIFWFDDKNTENGILTSIYELLFLYCLTMIIFRIMTYIKNTRW